MARVPPAPHSPHALPTTLADIVGLWRMDEAVAASNLVDAGGRALTLTVSGSPPVAAPIFPATGTVGSRSFDGATRWALQAAHTASLELLFQGEWTWEAWVFPTSTVGNQCIFSYGEYEAVKTAAGNSQIQILNNVGALNVSYENGAGVLQTWSGTPGAGLVQNTRNHVAVRRRFSMAPQGRGAPGGYIFDFFINGCRNQWSVVPTVANTSPTGGSTGRIVIGGSLRDGASAVAPGKLFIGRIDDVRMVTQALPDYAIRADFYRGARDFNLPKLTQFAQGSVSNSGLQAPARGIEHRVLISKQESSAGIEGNAVDLSGNSLVSIGSLIEGAGLGADNVVAPGRDFVQKIDVSDDADGLGMTASITLSGRSYQNNLSPFVSSDAFDFNAVQRGASGVVLVPSRRVLIQVAVLPDSYTSPVYRLPSQTALSNRFDDQGDWITIFDGFLVSASVSEGEVTLNLMDQMSALLDVWCEASAVDGKEVTYGTVAGRALESVCDDILDDNNPALYSILAVDDNGAGTAIILTLWDTDTATGPTGRGKPIDLEVGDSLVIRGTVNFNSAAGTADPVSVLSATQVTVTRTIGAFAAETTGSVFTRKGYRGHPGALLGGRPRIWVPTSPVWNLFEFSGSLSKSVGQELVDIVAEIGWKLAYRWDDALGFYRLKLYNPATSPPAWTIDIRSVLSVDRQSVKKDDIRNVIVVEYGKAAAVDNLGQKVRRTVSATNAASVTKYGRRYARVAVASTSLITAAAEAQALANRMVADLCEPVSELEITIPFNPGIEANDQVTLTSESSFMPPTYFATTAGSFVFGVIGVKHSISGTEVRTSLSLRSASTPAKTQQHFAMIQASGAVQGKGLRP